MRGGAPARRPALIRSGTVGLRSEARPALDRAASDGAAALVASLGVSVADAHLGEVLASRPGRHVVLTSDPGHLERVVAGADARVVLV